MRNIIVGTAGHIDHGKTALVQALTGTEGDRLAEEKRRGITIELGFAHLQIANDLRLGFIDVPGHERFVRNMLAGAAGIDLVLFVVAADESIKPQTREHFEICRMLGVRAGVIAITKSDAVAADLVDLVRVEMEELVADSFLAGAAMVAVSSVSGSGLNELRMELERAARAVEEKNPAGIARLPIDRAFSMKGFGTVVTGTLIAGMLRRDEEVELHPTGRRLRVRGLQVYGAATDVARAGERTAVNLAGIETGEVERGMVLAEAGRLVPVRSFYASVEFLAGVGALKPGSPVHLHVGTASIEAKLRRVGKWARVLLGEPALVLPGDRFIVRRFSPVVTIGGGVVVDISARRRTAADLERLFAGNVPARVEFLVSETPFGISEAAVVALTGAAAIPQSPPVRAVDGWRIAETSIAKLAANAIEAVRDYHARNPMATGMPKQELKGRTMPDAPAVVFETVLDGASELTRDGDVVRLSVHRVALDTAALEKAFASAGLAVPAVAEVLKASGVEPAKARSLLQALLTEGKLTRIAPDLVIHSTAVEEVGRQLAARRGERFRVTEFKAWTGVSRKYAIPLLEFFDRRHVTRREGDERVVI